MKPLYATETQEESDARRAKHNKTTPVSPEKDHSALSTVNLTSDEAIAFEPLLIEALEPTAKQATILNKRRPLGVSN